MITQIDILTAVNKKLQNHYKNRIKVYGREVSDGYNTPSFFTEVIVGYYAYQTTNYANVTSSFKITYFQKHIDDADNLKVLHELVNLFGQKLEVGERLLTISGYSVDYVGERNTIMQITFNLLEWSDYIGHEEDIPIAENLELTEETKAL